jgi:soluble lytic murein transglycosylase-like protein
MIKDRKILSAMALLVALALPLNTIADAAPPVPPQKPELSDAADKVQTSAVSPPKQPSHSGEISERPLAKAQADIYSRIFALQSQGRMDDADTEIAKIRDQRLMGHVLYQRYMHPTAYKSTFEELKDWLDIYADHPGASRIYRMANNRRPAGFSGQVKKPEAFRGISIVREPTVERAKQYAPETPRSRAQETDISNLEREIDKNIRGGSPSHALRLLKNSPLAKHLDQTERDIIKSRIAAGFFHAGRMDQSYKLARQVVQRSGENAPQALWIAGLISWKEKKYTKAAEYFEMAAYSPYLSGWNAGGAAFWAARAHMRSGNVKDVSRLLHKAHEHPRTFYGLLAARALGKDFQFDWKIPAFTRDYYNALNASMHGRRAMALVAAGQMHLAEAELVRISPLDHDDLYTALLAYADFADLPALAFRVGGVLSDSGKRDFYDMALYPVSSWMPSNGFEIDPALIHAIMRQESRFNPHAKSPSGARGLMQIMPATASYITDQDFTGRAAHKLLNPQTNLDIGQYYIKRLMGTSIVGGDMIKMLAAYNAGPGNLQKWQRQMGDVDDPLLFIEMLPMAETRSYVERVLSNYWIYRLRDNRETPSLDLLAQGQWPIKSAEEFLIALQN